MRARIEIFWAIGMSACTLVVGSDPRLDTDAGEQIDATDEASLQIPDASAPPLDAGHACDAAGCNATKDVCKKACADTAKNCNDGCNEQNGKGCHDLCNQQQQSCNAACVSTCLQCVMGCGTCGS
jgi:hypothetical protein